MKNKYLIIDQDGIERSIESYLNSAQCSEDFAILIKREALKEKVMPKPEAGEYLKVAAKFGFSWEKNCDIGFINYDHKAQLISNLVKEYSKQLVSALPMPVYEVSGSNFFDLKHPVVQAYANLFGDRLFRFNSDEGSLVMSYDASYPQFNLASQMRLKENDLPFAHFSISDCYRNEQSGECMLLFRSKRFNMPDLHAYFASIDQAWQYYEYIEAKIKEAFALVNRDFLNIAKISSEKSWSIYKEKVCEIAKRNNKPILVEIRCEKVDRYWIVDIDYSFIDSYNQVREVGCIQIDVASAKRLAIQYEGKDDQVYNPVIIHAAVPGGIERFIYMILDDYKKCMPDWLWPVQLRILPVSDKYVEHCKKIYPDAVGINRGFLDARLGGELRVEIDDRNFGVSKKVKLAREDLVPEIKVIGAKEVGV